jgi:protease I
MNALPILLIVASQNYQPIEYGDTRNALEQKGFTVIVASDETAAVGHSPQDPQQLKILAQQPSYIKIENARLLSSIKPSDYQGIFIIGGPGALEHLNNDVVKKIMEQAEKNNIAFGAICISPRILAQAGLLNGKKATGWDGDHQLEAIFNQHNVTYAPQSVVTDGKVVTANGPSAAKAFGEAIVTLLKK